MKMLICLLLIRAQPSLDFTSIKIKYEEGFMVLPGPDNSTEIITVKHGFKHSMSFFA
jgi:hypothetical protein